jgi:predicted small metal-binding protein
MGKVLRCYDVGSDCDFTIRAETEEEILKIAQEHAKTNHNMDDFSPETFDRLKTFIKDD